MQTLRPAAERGHANHGWLDSHHSFSFAGYHDPRHMGFGPLRVINEDRVQPGRGFDTHGHRDMEIISVVLSGELAHQDSMGNGAVIRPGEIQRLTAGPGVTHSEFNPSDTEGVHFLQIWIEPERRGLEPGYAQAAVDPAARRGRLALMAGPRGGDAAVSIHQDARLWGGDFDGDERASLHLATGRRGYVFLARGTLIVNGHALAAGDALLLEREHEVSLSGGRDAQVLVFDLP